MRRPTLPHLEDSERLDALVTRIAVIGSVGSTGAYVLAFLVTQDPVHLASSLGPGVAALFFLGLKAAGRESAFAAMMFGATTVIASFILVGTPSTAIGSALALVYIGMVGATFMYRTLRVYLVVGGIVVAITPLMWASGLPEGVSVWATSMIMTGGFILGSTTVAMLRRRGVELATQLATLFDSAPIGLVEHDWSEAAARLRDALPSGADIRAALSTDPDLLRHVLAGVVNIRANHTMLALGGARLEDALGPIRAERVTESSIDRWVEHVAVVAEGGGTIPEVPFERIDGRLIYLDIEVIVVDGRLESVISAATDVTQRRQGREALESLVKAKDQFIASVSHELRTPLTAVMGLTDELRSGHVTDPAEIKELLDLVAAQSREVAYIVQDLLVGARADIGTVSIEAEPVQLEELVAGVVSDLGAEVSVEPGCDLPPVVADPVRARQVVRNLVTNAERYGGPGRRAVFGRDDIAVWFEMRDSGAPLGDEARDRIFEPYERAHERPGVAASVGLGLSVSRQLAHLMGGDLVYEHDGETVFRFVLPAAGITEEGVAHSSTEPTPLPTGGS